MMQKQLFTKVFTRSTIALFLMHAPLSAEPVSAKITNHPAIVAAKKEAEAFTLVSEAAMPAVVHIKAEFGAIPHSPYDDFFGDHFFPFFDQPGRRPRGHRSAPQVGIGSGFLFSDDGYIMTNYHVIKDAKKITVDLHDPYHPQLSAKLVGGDEGADIAILKVEGKKLPYLKFGDSVSKKVGEWVLAIGSPFHVKSTVTHGIISGLGRNDLEITSKEDFIQTDANINPGNSGGPLLDLNGEVIGMNTAILSPSGASSGIGFAIPSRILIAIKEQILTHGKVAPGFLGITMQPIDEKLAKALNLTRALGALVVEVEPNSPSEKAGIKQGDVILEVNGNIVKSPNTLATDISILKPNDIANLKINRNGKIMMIKVKVGSIKNTKHAHASSLNSLGFDIETITPSLSSQYGYPKNTTGVIVLHVQRNSVADQQGVRKGWVIQSVNNIAINNVKEFAEALSAAKGRTVLMRVNINSRVVFVPFDVP